MHLKYDPEKGTRQEMDIYSINEKIEEYRRNWRTRLGRMDIEKNSKRLVTYKT